MQPDKNKMKKNPGLPRPFINTFNHFIGVALIFSIISLFRHFVFETNLVPRVFSLPENEVGFKHARSV